MHSILLVVLSSVLSCSKVNVDKQESDIADVPNMVMTQEYNIPIKSGAVTIVTYKGDTLAVTSKPMTILIPKDAVTKSNSSQLNIEYDENLKIDFTRRSYSWQVIAFEDSHKGDYDYNDLILHLKYELKDNIMKIGIHPVALGSTKDIELGYRLFQNGQQIGADKIVSDNCRRDFFNDKSGFINTVSLTKRIPWFIKSKIQTIELAHPELPVYVVWFIRVDKSKDGYREYCVVNQEQQIRILDDNHRPYGIVFNNLLELGKGYNQSGQPDGSVGLGWFAYPLEGRQIDAVYSLFDSWVKGEVENFAKDYYNPQTGETNNFNIDLSFKIYDESDQNKCVYIMSGVNLFK